VFKNFIEPSYLVNQHSSNIGDLEFRLFKSGDEQSFKRLFFLYYNHIVGFSSQFINDYDKAKSIAQDAFIKLWQNRENVETANGIRSFLYTSAKTDCLNYLRHEKVVRKHVQESIEKRERDMNLEVLKSMGLDSLEFSELDDLIKKTIEGLTEKCRQVFIKSRFENKKNHEIAEEMGIAVKSVEANMTRALKAFRKALSDYQFIFFILFY